MFDSYSQEKKSPAVFILNFRIQTQTQICAELYILDNSGPKLFKLFVSGGIEKYC